MGPCEKNMWVMVTEPIAGRVACRYSPMRMDVQIHPSASETATEIRLQESADHPAGVTKRQGMTTSTDWHEYEFIHSHVVPLLSPPPASLVTPHHPSHLVPPYISLSLVSCLRRSPSDHCSDLPTNPIHISSRSQNSTEIFFLSSIQEYIVLLI